MNAAEEHDRLPHSIAGLIGFALGALAANAPLYLALSAGVFAAYAIAEFAIPVAALSTPQGEFKTSLLLYAGLFVDALVIAAVALGVGTRAAGAAAPLRALAGGAVERWLPVIAVSVLAASIQLLTSSYSGLSPSPVPRELVLVAAPLIWILWAILGMTGPLVALGASRSLFAVIVGFGRAFGISLHRENLLRLCVLALILIVPDVFESIAFKELLQRHVARAFFWVQAPFDALTVAPTAAIATAFALDFARRAGLLEQPPPER